MKISIVTPSYNQGRFIDDAIQSVLTQGYSDFEHIIIDACSTDDTIERLKKYPHLQWVSEPDEGQSDAINKGFALATGDIIGWLNADDFYLPGTFHKVIAEFTANKKIHGVYADINFCDKEGVITGRLNAHSPLKFLSLFHCYVPSESFFFKRVILDDNIRIDKDYDITMDKKFVAQILYKNYRLKYIRDSFTVFRRHDANKSLETSKVKLTRAREGVRLLNDILKIKIPENYFTIKMYIGIRTGLLPLRRLMRLF